MAVLQQPDLILLDVMMPGQDGYEVCRSLRKNKLTSDTPVIFIIDKNENIDKFKGLDIGGVDYVTKPYQPAEVVARIHTHLELKAMREENLEYRKQLLRLQRMASISTLVDGAARKISNLMSTVIYYANVLQDNLDHNEKAHHYSSKVLETSERITDLVRDLLTYTRAGSSNVSSINVEELLIRMVRLYRDRDSNEVHINLQIPQDVPEIQADYDQIFQALSNIFINGWEAIPDGGVVTISVRTGQLPPDLYRIGLEPATNTCVIISISDTGAGMDEEIVGRIFEPFFTTKQTAQALEESDQKNSDPLPANTRKPDTGGAGLGLSAACGIIQKHGGAISVDSERGKGSTFHVYLPVAGA